MCMLAGCAPLSEQDLHLLGSQMHRTLRNQAIDAESTSKIIKKGMKYAPESYIGEPDIYLYLRELKLEGQVIQNWRHRRRVAQGALFFNH